MIYKHRFHLSALCGFFLEAYSWPQYPKRTSGQILARFLIAALLKSCNCLNKVILKMQVYWKYPDAKGGFSSGFSSSQRILIDQIDRSGRTKSEPGPILSSNHLFCNVRLHLVAL